MSSILFRKAFVTHFATYGIKCLTTKYFVVYSQGKFWVIIYAFLHKGRGNFNFVRRTAMLMKGSIGKAVDEYATICKQLEELTQRKEELKEYLSRHKPFQNPGSIETENGTVLNLIARKGTEIPPEVQDVKMLLESLGQPEKLEQVVQVSLKLLKHHVPLSEYESLVKRKAGILAWTVQK